MEFYQFEGGSWRKFPFRFRGGRVVEEVLSIRGGVVGAGFHSSRFQGGVVDEVHKFEGGGSWSTFGSRLPTSTDNDNDNFY